MEQPGRYALLVDWDSRDDHMAWMAANETGFQVERPRRREVDVTDPDAARRLGELDGLHLVLDAREKGAVTLLLQVAQGVVVAAGNQDCRWRQLWRRWREYSEFYVQATGWPSRAG